MVRGIREHRYSPVELVERALALAEADSHHAFLTLCAERARDEARAAEREQLRGGELPPLLGVPIAVKDLHETAGVRTTYGSLAYADHVPDEDCVLVRRLRAAGAIVIGKTNTPAYGLLGETKNRLGPPCCNPHEPERTSGGSSGGSAAAVAEGIVPAATGTDSAGSINVPASYCGVFGLKPTLGRVPQVPVLESLLMFTVSGPIAQTPRDAALLLEVMAGHDARDPMSRPEPARAYSRALDQPLPRALRVAMSVDLGLFPVDEDVAVGVRDVGERLKALGCKVEHAHPVLEDPMGLYVGLYVPDSRAAGLGEPAALGELYPESIAELSGLPQLSAEEYVLLLNQLWSLRATVAEFMEDFDLMVIPSTATTAFPHDRAPVRIGGREVEPGWTTFMPFTPIVNMTAQPAANVPAGRGRDGLPLGALLVGRVGDDELVLRAAHALLA
jgi:Asp-tRNA(Asn)/Glu-tRNA(Gln) amidotransferase A subunit family amidase